MKNISYCGLSSNEIDKLLTSVIKFGWEKGRNDFINILSPERAEASFSLIDERQVSWKYLIDLRGERILNFDTTFGLSTISLSQHFDSVFTANFDKRILRCIQSRIEEANISNITYLDVNDKTFSKFSNGYFDSIILSNIDEIISSFSDESTAKIRILNLVKELYRMLAPDGFIYLSFRNKWSYLTFYEKPKDKLYSFWSMKRILDKNGFKKVKAHILSPDIKQTSDIMISGRQRAYRCALSNNYFKNMFFNSIFYKYFSPAIALVGYKVKTATNFIENLMDEINKSETIKSHIANTLVVRKCLVTYLKVILVIGDANDAGEKFVVYLPLNHRSLMRQRYECRIMSKLKISAQLSNRIPSFYCEGILSNQFYFIAKYIDGIPGDSAIFSTEEIMRRTAVLITEFHGSVFENKRMTADMFEKLFSAPINSLIDALGYDISSEMFFLKEYLRKRIIDRMIPLVWMHGDLHLENVLVNPQTSEILGIVDWSSAQKNGLPLIDIFFLIIRSSTLNTGKRFSDVIIEKILAMEFNSVETSIIDMYLNFVPVSRDIIFPLLLMTWINHIAYNLSPQSNAWWMEEHFRRVFKTLLTKITVEEIRHV